VLAPAGRHPGIHQGLDQLVVGVIGQPLRQGGFLALNP